MRTVSLLSALFLATAAGCVGSSGSGGYAGTAAQNTGGSADGGALDTGSQDDGTTGQSDATSTDASASTHADAGAVSTADSAVNAGDSQAQPPTDEVLAGYGIIKLAASSDGVEAATHTTSNTGVAVFYSPHHNALVEIEGLNSDGSKIGEALKDGVPVADLSVAVRVEKGGAVWALVTDPSGKIAPAAYSGVLKDGSITIDGNTAVADGTFEPEWLPEQANPYADKFALVGITVSMVIRFSLRTMVGMAIGAAVKSFVNKACLFANPLYTGWCGTLSDIAKELSGVFVSGIKMKFAGNLQWGSLLSDAATNIANYLIQNGCEKATGAALVAIGPTSNNPWPLYDANVGLWKKIQHKTTFMMNHLVNSPPADPAKKALIKPVVGAAIKFLAAIRPMVQKDVYVVHSSKAPQKISDGKPYTFTTKMIEAIADELQTVVTTTQLTTIISSVTTYTALWNGVLIQNRTFVLNKLTIRQTTSPWKPKGFNQALSCALGAIDGFGGYLTGGATFPVPYETMKYVNDALRLVERLLDETYGHVWGGAIAAPSCYPDLYEPNNKFNVGQNVKNLGSKVTISDVTSTEGDVDWYTLPLLGAWAKVQAGVAGRKPLGANDCGTVPAGAKLCVSMWWYSNIIDLSGTGPVQIGSEGCGVVSDGDFVDPEYAVPWWNVSKVTGEQDQKLLVRVRQPAGQSLNVPYKVMMFAGSIF